MKIVFAWIGALIVGTILGFLQIGWINVATDFIATVYTRLFQLLAVPTIVLAVITTLASIGRNQGRLFVRTLSYTLLTTLLAATVGALLFVVIAPGSLSTDIAGETKAAAAAAMPLSYSEHLLSVVPNNVVRPFLEGNVLSLLLLAFAVGIGLSKLPASDNKSIVLKALLGLQELLFLLIRALIKTLPLGIMAFAAQLSMFVSAGVFADSLARYVLVILGGNALQFFITLPLLLLVHKINPLKTLVAMMPAVMMALFTKSSAATLPVTMQTAEERLGVSKRVARFVLPICTTINMNGCAAFILVTSLFVMQSGGTPITLPTILLWTLVSVLAAVGNAGVPMGCYFLTLSLTSDMPGSAAIMGLILPIYTIIDMVETAENVWSDSCVAMVVNGCNTETHNS